MSREWRPLITRSCLFEFGHENPFSHLRISSSEFLEEINERGVCPKCHKSRMYFCYTCFTAVDSIRDRIPYLKLPMQIVILKHAGEVDGKSTAAHLPVLAPDHVKLYTFPNIPAFDPNEVLLLFPGENAQPFEKLWKSRQNGQTAGPCVICAKEHFNIPWKTLIFIDRIELAGVDSTSPGYLCCSCGLIHGEPVPERPCFSCMLPPCACMVIIFAEVRGSRPRGSILTQRLKGSRAQCWRAAVRHSGALSGASHPAGWPRLKPSTWLSLSCWLCRDAPDMLMTCCSSSNSSTPG
ncbi:uncharacterized protein [Dermacentor albipictus]|uniref:uncharacterized protein isoform X1 n=1 Tax=Dermacentor albipictus TaxID=60249 RepID=UPI0038FC4E16